MVMSVYVPPNCVVIDHINSQSRKILNICPEPENGPSRGPSIATDAGVQEFQKGIWLWESLEILNQIFEKTFRARMFSRCPTERPSSTKTLFWRWARGVQCWCRMWVSPKSKKLVSSSEKNLKFLVYMDEMAHFDRERIPERVRINSFLRKHFSVKNYKIASFIFRIFFIDGFWWPNRIFLGKENIFLWTWTLFFLVRNLMNFRLCMQKVAVLMAILRWPAAKSANTAKLRCSARSASEPRCSSASPVLVGFCWKISISVR